MIFSPGDYVLSSSKIIQQMKPDLKYEKLRLLMDTENINFSDIKKILKNLSTLSVHVLGDTIVDTNNYCQVIGGLHKTPTLSIAKESSENFLGGAGIVASHFKSFCKNVSLQQCLQKIHMESCNKKFEKNKIQVNSFGRWKTYH